MVEPVGIMVIQGSVSVANELVRVRVRVRGTGTGTDTVAVRIP